MTAPHIALILAVAWLAYANGANDNFKGVATLFGSGTASYRRALWWAMATTLAGALTAVFLGHALIQAFSGKGLVDAAALAQPTFLLAVVAGAAATVLLATLTGFPISTTHAILGALIGAGLLAPGGVMASRLLAKFLLPLLLTPFAAVAVTFVLYAVLRRVRLALGVTHETCLCVGGAPVPLAEASVHACDGGAALCLTSGRIELAPAFRRAAGVIATEAPALSVASYENGQVVLRSADGASEIHTRLSVAMDDAPTCEQRYGGRVVGVRAQAVLDALHFLSAGAVGFARGLQDSAKIVGLLVGAGLVGLDVGGSVYWGLGMVAVMMAAGGLLHARKVAETLSGKITDMNHGQGFTANFVTSGLVIGTALYGMPVSTTHCSVGSLFGIGVANGSAKWKTIGRILLAWLVTLPVAATVAGLLYLILR